MIWKALAGVLLLAGVVMWGRLIRQIRRAVAADRGHCPIILAVILAWFAMFLTPAVALEVILGRKPPTTLTGEGSQ